MFLPRNVVRGALVVATVASIALAGDVAHAHEPDAEEVALGSLVDAELAFARMALERGIREAFLANFASDGVVFEPAPVRIHAAWAARAEPADPRALRLEWQPAQAAVARSFDMGFTTGPYKLTDARRPDFVRHGAFFSVWQRDGRGPWRVAIDLGATTPTPPDFVPLGAAPRPGFVGKANVAAQRATLLALETRRLSTGRAYESLLAGSARLYRDNMLPIAGRDAVAREMAALATEIEWLPFDVRVARSADMAASYGKFRASGGRDGVVEGYYVHVWLRDAIGRWRLAYDIANRDGP